MLNRSTIFILANNFALIFLMSSGLFAAKSYALIPDSYSEVSILELPLNRNARTLSNKEMGKLHHAHTGFSWNSGDNNTNKWRPQGISGIKEGDRKFLVVSWYGREEANYEGRGVRLSFVDVTSMRSVKYRHVLLVDEAYNTFNGMHAGGLVYRDGKIYVPDTRAGMKKIHVFSSGSIKKVPVSDRSHFYEYAYILKRESSYDVSLTPSFMSFDWSRDQFVIGSFSKNEAKNLQWYSGPYEAEVTVGPFYKKMQGVASEDGKLWISTSYGRNSDSHLYYGAFDPESSPNLSLFEKLDYPPGLEDMHISQSSNNLWMLTEFGPHEGRSNNRVVFATKKSWLMPKERSH